MMFSVSRKRRGGGRTQIGTKGLMKRQKEDRGREGEGGRTSTHGRSSSRNGVQKSW